MRNGQTYDALATAKPHQEHVELEVTERLEKSTVPAQQVSQLAGGADPTGLSEETRRGDAAASQVLGLLLT